PKVSINASYLYPRLRADDIETLAAHGCQLARGRETTMASTEFKSFRRDAVLGEEPLQHDRLAGGRDQHVPGRHWRPVRAIGVERLGDHHGIAAGVPVIEGVGVVVGGIAERI